MPIVRVEMLEGRSPELREKLIEALSETVVNTLKVRPEQVRVVLIEVPKSNWGIAGKTVARREREEGV